LICGLRKGGKQYFALDITDTLNPVFLWEFPRANDAATLAKVGESSSEPVFGLVKVEQGSDLYERWVAFIGGGQDPNEKKDKNAVIGRGFYVIDVKTGDILWELSKDDSVTYPDTDPRKYMTHAFPASSAAVDLNSDGYVDKVYIGDRGGQMWVFDVSFNALTKKSNSQWTGKRLFKAPGASGEKHNIYYPPAIAFDKYHLPWVYFGTGDREDPTDTTNTQERFYAMKDDGLGNYPRQESDLRDVTSLNTFSQDLTKKGWFIKLEQSGGRVEKVLARPAVFNQLLYFTTYTYKGTSACSVEGDARLYIAGYLSGGGALTVDELSDLGGTPSSERYKTIGLGVPSNPIISVNNKGVASIVIGTTNNQVFSQQVFSSGKGKSLLYWREVTR
jgi:type IV pilus assembly protein PilY1